MKKEFSISKILHPLTLNSFSYWRRLSRTYPIDEKYQFKANLISFLSPLSAPLRFLEHILYEQRVSKVEIAEPPIFIIGHWRTGTTHLHNILCQDPNLGYVTLFQTLAPSSYFVSRRILLPILNLLIPEKRHMDNLPLGVDLPQEEEMVLPNLCNHSFYLGLYFPRQMRQFFRKYVLFNGISETNLDDWRKTYLKVLRVATLHAGRKRLVLKNPTITAHLRHILELFPDAKFIHICRNPYEVFKSTTHFYRSTFDIVSFQDIDDQEIRENVLLFFRELMTRYFEEKDLIPPGNLCEVRFENLEANPLEETARVYRELGLPGWDKALPHIKRYLESQNNYEKNTFTLAQEDIDQIEREWKFAIDAWGYERPPVEPAG